ncbi:MAG: amino acid adenylation domain-containing protein [Deltaproteobacteria bacterium]|nr:amino acid adenylation domain-containing protein [Deltaproteobacteria bacterium]
MKTEKESDFTVHASKIQEQFWFISEITPENSAYNIISWFDGRGSFHPEAAQHALTRVVERHHALRCALQTENGQIRQVISKAANVCIGTHDLCALYKANPDEARDMMVQVARKPFDLTVFPLLRADLFTLEKNRFVFLLVFHHAIVDLHTKSVFSKEFSAFYNSFVANQPEPAFPPAVQYTEYVNWQQSWLQTDEPTKMAETWKRELELQSGVLNLPADYPRKSVAGLKGNTVDFTFSNELFIKVQKYCEQNRLDKFLLLLTAYLVLLYKHTNQSDITVGVPLSNRRHRDFKDVIGCFVNVMPLAFSVQPEMTVADLLKQVRHRMLLAHRNQELPIQHLLKILKPVSNAGTNPIYQTAFTVEPPMNMELLDVEMIPVKLHHGGAQLDLFMSFWDVTSSISGYLEYDTGLFRTETVEGMVRRFQTLVARFMDAVDTRVADVEILDADERHWLISKVNQTQCDLPDLRLHELVSMQVQKSPDKIAFKCGQSQLSYGDLHVKSNRLAHYLRKNGVTKGSLVGVYLYRSTEMMVAILAILKAGAAYVPLDPKFPNDRLNYIVDVTNIPVLITQTSLAGNLQIKDATAFCIDGDAAQLDSESIENLSVELDAADRAYVLFTSGSTGKPKGIPIHHEAVVNFLLSMAKQPGISSEDVLLAVTTLSFDISILELFLPVIQGATVVIASSDDAVNGEALLRLIEDEQITVLQGTPSSWQILLGAGLGKHSKLKILCGGEAMPQKLSAQLCDVSSDVWNMYGPTETTVWSTCCKVEKDAPIRIGAPIDNTQLYIVDEQLRLVPPGVAGELVIGGAGVSHGYLNRPDLNKTQFGDDPFQEHFANRIYRTGDLARYHFDGSLEHLGRTDSQIKLRGFRIELSEIESVLSGFPQVRQCAVVLARKSSNDSRLVAYVTHSSAAALSESEMMDFLRKALPDYMVPTFFEQLDAMPMTANGKIDRKRLPAPTWSGSLSAAPENPPANETEGILLSIWASVIGISNIGMHDNFFDVGGNSLMVLELTSQVESRLGKKITVTDFFQYPTISALSKYLIGDTDDSNSLSSVARSRAEKRNKARLKRTGGRLT